MVVETIIFNFSGDMSWFGMFLCFLSAVLIIFLTRTKVRSPFFFRKRTKTLLPEDFLLENYFAYRGCPPARHKAANPLMRSIIFNVQIFKAKNLNLNLGGKWITLPCMDLPIISHFQAKEILAAMQEKKEQVRVSLDLGLTTTPLSVTAHEVSFPDGQKLSFKQLKKVLKHENKCYFVRNSDLEAINIFSESTGWMRTLYPTHTAPTTLVSGFLMHRVKNTDPLSDTKEKVKALGKMVNGRVLDTSFGMGYTAMELAKSGKVTTVEIDPVAIELSKLNPWSAPLFLNENIEVIVGDIQEVIDQFSENEFTYILHDPPTFKLAGELYSLDFYKKLYRVLKSGGVLFHYIGDPDSALGSSVTKGVIERLKEAGFHKIGRREQAFGVVATK